MNEKIKALVVGKRSWTDRFFTVLAPCALMSFLLLCHGPLDISYMGRYDLSYSLFDIMPLCLCLFIGGTLISALFLSLIGGKVFTTITSLILATGVAMYIQGAFLNPSFGTLDGRDIIWQDYVTTSSVSLCIWGIIFLLPILLRYFSRRVWVKTCRVLPLFLIVIQVIPFITKMIDQHKYDTKTGASLHASTMYEYSLAKKENIVVFIVDSLSNRVLRNAAESYPDILDDFHDFTYYDNMNTSYLSTFPSVTYLLTQTAYDCENESVMEYFNRAWAAAPTNLFFNSMKENGWELNLYGNSKDYGGGNVNLEGRFSNVQRSMKFSIAHQPFIQLLRSSFFRYLPTVAKPFAWTWSDALNDMKIYEYKKNMIDTGSYRENILRKVTLNDKEKQFMIIHWDGAHEPALLNEQLETQRNPGDMNAQVAGYFYLLSDYFRIMKDLGVYDNAEIIVMADHGDFQSDAQPALLIKHAGESHAEMRNSHAPIEQKNFLPTIAQAASLNIVELGRSFDEVGEEELFERCMRWRRKDLAYPRIPGHTNVMYEYCYTGNGSTLREVMQSNQYTVHPMIDNYF